MSDPAAARSPQPGDARQALIEAALAAFAEHGINGVSMRTVTARAGQLNQSAISYHFGSKEGLVAAVLAHVMAELRPGQDASLTRLATRKSGEWASRELTRMMCDPFVMLYRAGDLGQQAIRFLSRLTWQEGGKGQSLLVAAVQPYFARFAPAFLAINPGKPLDAMALQIYLAVNTLIHALSDVTLLATQPVQGLDTSSTQQPERLIEFFYDYIAGGLTG